jgi:hypothetical protein
MSTGTLVWDKSANKIQMLREDNAHGNCTTLIESGAYLSAWKMAFYQPQ